MSEPCRTRGSRVEGATAADGVVLVVFISIMIPLLTLAAAATMLMTGRNSQLLRGVQEAKALLAAEAGMNETVYRIETGTLTPGVPVGRDLGSGRSYVAEAHLLSSDGLDNDADGVVDEIDESAFQIVVTGIYARAVKRLAGIVREPTDVPGLAGGILCLGSPEIRATGNSTVSGRDTNLNGTPGDPTKDVFGIAIVAPGTLADLNAGFTGSGSSTVDGKTASPSLGASSDEINLAGLVASVRHHADTEIEPGTYSTPFGDWVSGDTRVAYCPGNLKLTAGGGGAGILVVAGDLKMTGSIRWDGLVVVLGDFEVVGGALVHGGVIQGPDGAAIKTAGTGTVRYSSAVINQLRGAFDPGFVLEGWREISRN